ncbi:N-acetylneuraminate synthase family protein [uncultured Victivallis sp.]|uniref:N-acetylneuraminate synthase family protein n=1 Tax=uncultured Victivallis sp. TaxID=354118 RepID=UPI0025F781A9|nr:N-acetylneuraminate synthase family protein [uncultured Victivallis sp.]
MKDTLFDRLIILELANNHMGNVEHGLNVIRAFGEVIRDFPDFRFAFKFQYRDLDTFIHPDYRERMDLKYIKRFSETRLSEADFLRMKQEAEQLGFHSMCTPFDERSVERIVEQNFEYLKIASCSCNDWPLLERVVQTDKPIVISTAGAALEEIDNVVNFLQHRDKKFCLMHCVGSYPTPAAELELNQIDFFRQRYPGVPVGFSTHEEPGDFDPVKLAVAKGAVVLERHVGVATEAWKLNAYSSTPEQIREWLKAARKAYAMCGVSGMRRPVSEKERADLRGLQRGVFARRSIAAGEKLTPELLFYAIPNQPDQFVANDLSKYLELTAKQEIPAGAPIRKEIVEVRNNREKVLQAVRQISELLRKSGLHLQDKLELELSHHYGIDRFYEYGCTIITCVNREYCKKIILLLPGQENPTHTHHRKEETFHILYGDLSLTLNGVEKLYHAGEIVVVERGTAHKFSSPSGAVLEEISTTHYKDDSFYDDPAIKGTASRKTYLTFYADWLNGEVR